MAQKGVSRYFAAKLNAALMRVMPALEGYADAMGWDGAVSRTACYEAMRKTAGQLDDDPDAVVLPNPDRESFFNDPFVVVHLREVGATRPKDMSQPQFIAAAAMMGWNERLFRATMMDASGAPGVNPAYVGFDQALADEVKDKPLGLGALEFSQGEGKENARVNFLYDNSSGAVVMVGDAVTDKQQKALEHAGVTYGQSGDFSPDLGRQGWQNAKSFLSDTFNRISPGQQSALCQLAELKLGSGGLPLDEIITQPGKTRATGHTRYRLK